MDAQLLGIPPRIRCRSGPRSRSGSAISDAEYERKVAGLAERACTTDIASDPDALATYKDGLRVLSQGDHYILIMLKQRLSGRLRPWWAFWRF